MKLTVFLVTKGREKFLDQILNSFEQLFELNVDFLILDNGAPRSIGVKLKSWQSKNPKRIKIVRFETNDSRPSTSWEVLKENNVDWVVCPSDDDEIRFEIIADWEKALNQNPDMVGFAASAAIMDENGNLTGEIIFPSASRYNTAIEQMAGGFYEPPFHWPCLFIRASSLPAITPNSRFVFDWWLGLRLLIAGTVVTSESIGVNYRVHPQQESFLAPLRRKFFEAHIWINDLANSADFIEWVQSLSDPERVRFWDLLLKSLPIYGDSDFSRPILNTIYVNLVKTSGSTQTAIMLANSYAFSMGVLLKNGEVKNLISQLPTLLNSTEGNINVLPAPNVCGRVKFACGEISSESAIHHYFVSCIHSEKPAGAIEIDCNTLHENLNEINADFIVGQITEYLEKNGSLSLIITSGEKILIQAFRKWKNRMPKFLRIYLRVLKSRS
jgi:hypothetical protein